MSDEADNAQDHMEREDVVRRKYRQIPTLEAEVTGECLNCFEPVGFGMRWCDADCRKDWDARRNR